MKTPEEIKKVLECCAAQFDGRCEEYVACVCCPLFVEDVGVEDVVAYIERLEAQVTQLLEEREEEMREREREDFGAITVEEARMNGWR